MMLLQPKTLNEGTAAELLRAVSIFHWQPLHYILLTMTKKACKHTGSRKDGLFFVVRAVQGLLKLLGTASAGFTCQLLPLQRPNCLVPCPSSTCVQPVKLPLTSSLGQAVFYKPSFTSSLSRAVLFHAFPFPSAPHLHCCRDFTFVTACCIIRYTLYAVAFALHPDKVT